MNDQLQNRLYIGGTPTLHRTFRLPQTMAYIWPAHKSCLLRVSNRIADKSVQSLIASDDVIEALRLPDRVLTHARKPVPCIRFPTVEYLRQVVLWFWPK